MHNLPLKPMESTTSSQSTLPCSCLLNICCQQGTVALVSADGHCFSWDLCGIHLTQPIQPPGWGWAHTVDLLCVAQEHIPCKPSPSPLHSLINKWQMQQLSLKQAKQSSLTHVVKSLWKQRGRLGWKILSAGKGSSYLHSSNFQQNLRFLLCSKSSVNDYIHKHWKFPGPRTHNICHL